MKIKKSLAILMAVIMLLSMVPTMAFAADDALNYWEYQVENGELTVIGFNNNNPANLVIPAEIEGKPVTRIGDDAFRGRSSFQTITIPDSVTSIDRSAFCGCSSLESITIPDSVTSIGDGAFDGCTSLQSITIPDSVTSIGESAFGGCSSLQSITIPDSVTSIGRAAFYGCSSIQSITISDSVTSIGSNVFTGTAYYDNESNWENDVLYIGAYLFDTKKEISGNYEVKNGTKIIADNAFFGCSSLENITIPDSVTSIGLSAFGCSSLENITIPDSVTSIGGSAFFGCSSLESVTIPGSVTNIDDYAFSDCSSLQNITIPNSVTSIGQCAFVNCSSLQNITIPDSVTSIEDSVFYNTAYYNNESNWENGVLYIGNHLIKAKEDISGDYEVKNGTKTIAGGVFYNCSSLQNITIPDSVTSIGGYAFFECTSLQSITIPDSVKSFGEVAFCHCSSLESITIPDSVTSIGNGAFEGCSALQSITIPDSVTSIGSGAFYGTAYDNNESNWENGVLYIGNHLIEAKNDISGDYEIKNGTKTIANNAFSYRSSLQSITIPDSVTSIGEYAFYGCSSLATVNYTSTKKQWGKISVCDGNGFLTAATINFAASCAHSNTTVIPAVPATCTEKGMTEGKKCEDCDEIITAQTDIPTKEHSFGEWTTKKEATYSATGEKIRKCSACNKTETETIAKLVAKNETLNSNTNVVIKYADGVYNGKLALDVKKEIEGESVNFVIKEKGEYKSVVFDITPMIDGKKVQPNGKVLVGIPLPDGYDKNNTKVYFVGAKGLEALDSYYKDGKIWFETDHFSKYALVNEINNTKYKLGDINGDGKVTATDARIILRISAKLEKLEDQKVTAFEVADVNGDGKITSVDARKVLRVATKLESFNA